MNQPMCFVTFEKLAEAFLFSAFNCGANSAVKGTIIFDRFLNGF